MTLLRGALSIAALVCVFAGVRLVRAYRWSDVDFHPPPLGALSLPASGPLSAARSVAFGEGVRGWLVPSRNGAAIVLLHGTETDRRSMIPHAEVLARNGFGVLLYDSPGHGESAGAVRWNDPERRALHAAIDLLLREPGTRNVGAVGTSMGGYVLVSAASAEPRLRAFALFSTFADLRNLTLRELGPLGFFTIHAGMWAVRRNGLDPAQARPVDHIAEIAPRPLLLVSGELDRSIPPEVTKALFEAAREPKQLWIAPGAAHGEELKVDPKEAEPRLLATFAPLLR